MEGVRGAEEGDDRDTEGVGKMDGRGVHGGDKLGTFQHGGGAEEAELAGEDRGQGLMVEG